MIGNQRLGLEGCNLWVVLEPKKGLKNDGSKLGEDGNMEVIGSQQMRAGI